MTEIHERDAMTCRACGNEERASEGYPCAGCGTFVCQICTMRGVQYCRHCQEQGLGGSAEEGAAGGGAAATNGSTGGDGGGA